MCRWPKSWIEPLLAQTRPRRSYKTSAAAARRKAIRMNPYRSYRLSAVPQTLHTQLEIAKAIRTLAGPDQDELLRQRRAEIAAIRRDLDALRRVVQRLGEELPALVMAELQSELKKYSPEQLRVPAGNPDGGQWTSGSKGGTDALDVQNDIRNLYHALVTAGRSRLGSFAHVFGSHDFDINRIGADEVPVGHPRQPVPFVDSDDKQIFDAQGNPLLRPIGLPPELYVQAGFAIRPWADVLVGLEQEKTPDAPDVANTISMASAAVASKILLPLTPGAALDAERFDWNYVRDYRHYQNTMIGVYGAAAGLSQDDVLSLVDLYAAIVSHFSPSEHLDEVYTHSAKQDVEDTKLGYALYQSGRIRLNK
jgi:hypothetical protein